MVNVAIIGFGFMGQKHAQMINSFPSMHLCGVFDIRQWKNDLAKNLNIHVYNNYEDMLSDSQVQVIFIALPNHLHKDYTIMALNSKKNVFCEKPVALNLSETKKMYTAAKKNGKMLFVHQNRRFDKDYLILKSLVDNKSVNNIRLIESNVVGARGIPEGWRREKKYGGGMLYDWGVHLIDQIYCLFGEFETIDCTMFHTQKFDADDGVMISLKLKNGIICKINIDTNTFVDVPRWVIYGSNATAIIKDWDCSGKIVYLDNIIDKDNDLNELGNGFSRTMSKLSHRSFSNCQLPSICQSNFANYQNVCDCIMNGNKQLVTNKEVMSVIKAIDYCFKSDKKKHTVNCSK